MRKIFCHENIVVIHNLRNLLQHNGIDCVIRNDLINSGAGEVPPIEVWPEIWLDNDRHTQKAEALIHEAMHGNPSKTSWFCPSCGETNEPAFEICWQCGTDCPLND